MNFDELIRQLAVLVGLLIYLLPLLSRLIKRQQPEEQHAPDAEADESQRPRQRAVQRRPYDAFEDPVPPRRATKKPAAPALRQARPSPSATREERPTGPVLRQARPLREFKERNARPQTARELGAQATDASPRGQLVIREDALQRPTKLGATEGLERRMRAGEKRAAEAERAMLDRLPRSEMTPPQVQAPQPTRASISKELLIETVVLNAALSRRRGARS